MFGYLFPMMIRMLVASLVFAAIATHILFIKFGFQNNLFDWVHSTLRKELISKVQQGGPKGFGEECEVEDEVKEILGNISKSILVHVPHTYETKASLWIERDKEKEL